MARGEELGIRQVLRTIPRLESLVAKDAGPENQMLEGEDQEREEAHCSFSRMGEGEGGRGTYFMEIPYWETCSYPDFQTSVTSQALVAWRRQERKADTAFPPTEHTLISSLSSVAPAIMSALGADTCVWWVVGGGGSLRGLRMTGVEIIGIQHY